MRAVARAFPMLLALLVPASAGAHARVTRHDRAATRAYLQSEYAYEQSLVAATPAANVALERLAARLAGECPAVLAGLRRESLGRISESQENARQLGEASRREHQRLAISYELSQAVAVALLEPVRSGALAHARAIAALHWSSAELTRYAHAVAAQIEWQAKSAVPAVCADMRAWALSGYTRLSAGTKAFLREAGTFTSRVVATSEAVPTGAHALRQSPEALLRATEGVSERALARKIRGLQTQLRSAAEAIETSTERLSAALGLHTAREEDEQPPTGATVIAHGQTAAGGSYTIWVEPAGARGQGPPCAVTLAVHESEGSATGFSGGTSSACLSRTRPERLRAFCSGTHWQVEGQTVEGAAGVILKLRGGTQIASAVALVPASLGGPAGFYFEVLPTSQDPVSLSELDAQGREVGSVQLPHQAKCPGQMRGLPVPPKPPLALESRRLASGHLPHGPRFEITGERVRFMGRVESHLGIFVFSEQRLIEIGGQAEELVTGTPNSHGPLGELRRETGCRRHEYSILYGVLKTPGDTVLARTSQGLERFRRVRIPASLHMRGLLTYIALPTTPSALIVRSPSGKVVFREDLRTNAREARETCEGEAEPPG
jgi:hypothetical protein